MEPVYVFGCKGVLGFWKGAGGVLLKKVEAVTVSPRGVSYAEHDKSGHVVDCKGGVLAQSFFNAFFSACFDPSAPGALASGQDCLAAEGELQRALLWQLAGGSSGFALEAARETLSSPALAALVRLASAVLLERRGARGEGSSERPPGAKALLLTERDLLEGKGSAAELLSASKDYAAIYFLTGIGKRQFFEFLKAAGKTPLLLLHELLEELESEELVQRPIFVVTHGWMSSHDIEIVARSSNTYVVHCPYTAAASGADGFFPLQELLKSAPDRVAIATCSPGSKTPFARMLEIALLEKLLASYGYWSTLPALEEVARGLFNGWGALFPKKNCVDEGCAPDLYVYASPFELPAEQLLGIPPTLPRYLVAPEKGLVDLADLAASIASAGTEGCSRSSEELEPRLGHSASFG